MGPDKHICGIEAFTSWMLLPTLSACSPCRCNSSRVSVAIARVWWAVCSHEIYCVTAPHVALGLTGGQRMIGAPVASGLRWARVDFSASLTMPMLSPAGRSSAAAMLLTNCSSLPLNLQGALRRCGRLTVLLLSLPQLSLLFGSVAIRIDVRHFSAVYLCAVTP